MWHSLEDDTDRWTEAICTAFGSNFEVVRATATILARSAQAG